MERNILGYRCSKCERMHYPNRARCSACGNIDFTTEPLPKNGVLLTYTVLYNLPPDFDVPTLTLGIVQLDGGPRITGQLRIDEPKSGMRVQGHIGVVRKDNYKTHNGMIFEAA
ncbi:MAG: OB-fold domain-containing protein [Candidatus Riflebacteria bacterium]|nr:OB-fold domain-containing protein [Candidatus Riflebacteria bacterium]